MNLEICMKIECKTCRNKSRCFKEDKFYSMKSKNKTKQTKEGERGGKVKMGTS